MRGRMGLRVALIGMAIGPAARAAAPDPEAAARGRVALTTTSFLSPAWSLDAYKQAGRSWGPGAPDPDREPDAYAAAFARRYGLHPAPYPNDGLPMGLRRAKSPDGKKAGLQMDCMICHGGSIGGRSYDNLGNSTLDLKSLIEDLTRADGKPVGPSLFTLTSSRGTVNAGQVAVLLLSLRNSDLSKRLFPLPLGANYPEMATPPWWGVGRKETIYVDGSSSADSVRTNMQFMLGELTLDQFKAAEPAFRDILAYFKAMTPPKYPFPIDQARADRGRATFTKSCARCHGTYGPGGEYPNRMVDLDVIGTDPVRARASSARLVAHYNSTWLGQDHPATLRTDAYQAPPLDGLWATAPYLHNGSVSTLHDLLKSADRPARFRRPPSTDFEHYDQVNVGWKAEPVAGPADPALPAHEARYIFDSSRWSLGNGGHTFGDKLKDEERTDLIEYLKTL